MTGRRKKVREEFEGEQNKSEKKEPLTRCSLFPANTQGQWNWISNDHGEEEAKKKKKRETMMGWERSKKR